MNTAFDSQTDEQDEYSIHEETLEVSREYAGRYVEEHKLPSDELTPEQTMNIGTARLQWALQQVRPQLSGIFTEDDIITLLDCMQGDLLYPDQFHSIPSFLCEHHGIEVDDYESTWLCELVNKLCDLDRIQTLALGDALEQAWHRGLKSNQGPEEFLLTLGIELV